MVGLSINPPPFPNIPVAAIVITTVRSLQYFKAKFLSPANTESNEPLYCFGKYIKQL